MDARPQFVEAGQLPGQMTAQGPSDGKLVLSLAIGPVVTAFVQLFWLALDEPPLPVLGIVVWIAAGVGTVAVTAELGRLRGLSTPVAVIVGIISAPFLIIAAMFLVIAGAFSLGALI